MRLPGWRGAALAVAAALALQPGTLMAQRGDVAVVYPTSDVVPERLLRVGIHFRGVPPLAVRDSVRLRSGERDLGDAVLSDALWSPDGRVLTLLLHPARVKTGLVAHERAGWALTPREPLTLLLGGHEVKRWSVIAGGCGPVAPMTWTLRPPAAGTRAPLVVTLTTLLDVRAEGLLVIADRAGRAVSGVGRLDADERSWRFTPREPWAPGAYALHVHPRTESICGDEPGDDFEHTAAPRDTVRPVLRRAFTIRPRDTELGSEWLICFGR